MPPRRNTPAPVVAAPVVAPTPAPVVAPAAAPAVAVRQFRIQEASVERLDGSPAFSLVAAAEGKKKKGDPLVVPGKTPGGAAKKAFTRMVNAVVASIKAADTAAGVADEVTKEKLDNLHLSYKFAIQEDGHRPHVYVCSRSPLDVTKTVTRTSKTGASTNITIRFNVECKAWKDPNAPVKAPRAVAGATAAPAVEEVDEGDYEDEQEPPEPVAPAPKRGKGKGKK
jgi:hypothetical protein